jgi:hypothetical protein
VRNEGKKRKQGFKSQIYLALGRVGIAQLVRFLVVEQTHPGPNPRFSMDVAFMTNYSFSGKRRPHRQ